MQNNLADEQQNWHRRILALSWPVILSNLSIPLVGLVDVAILGQLSEPGYIGAITVGTAVFSAIYWLFGFLRMGTTGLVAQAFGARDADEVNLTYARALLIAASLGIILVLIHKPLEHLLFSLFESSESIEQMAKEYFSIRIFSAPAVLISLASIGVLFGLQKMKTTLFLTIFLNLSNLSLDVLLVLVFDLGVKGVAIGTLISEWASALLGLFLVAYHINRSSLLKISREALFQKKQFSQFFDVSGNLIIRTFFVQIPFFVGTLLATGFGDLVLATHGILMQFYFMMTYGLDGFAHSAESLSGYYFGAKNKKHFRAACFFSSLWSLILALLIALVYWLLSDTFINFMTVSEDVRSTADDFTIWIALSPLFCVGAFVLDGIFIGITKIREMRNSMFFAGLVWIITLIISYESLGYHAIWLAMSAFMLSRAVFLGLYMSKVLEDFSKPEKA